MIPIFTGTIVEWDNARGHGWLECDGQRVFLHRREFRARSLSPRVGDPVRFIAGPGPHGNMCAQDVQFPHPRLATKAPSLFSLLVLAGLLILPARALALLPLPPLAIAGTALFLNVITYLAYRHDKQKAQAGHRRTSEATLHRLEFLGGWPAAYLAQRCLRHKNRKRSYQFIFWLIILAHQATASALLYPQWIHDQLKRQGIELRGWQ